MCARVEIYSENSLLSSGDLICCQLPGRSIIQIQAKDPTRNPRGPGIPKCRHSRHVYVDGFAPFKAFFVRRDLV